MDHRSILLALALVMCLTMLQHPASAKSSNDTEWLTPLNVTLHWGEQVEISGYTITAQDFSASKPVDTPDDYVMLKVKSNTSRSWGAILALNHSSIPNETILDGVIRLTAQDIVTGNNIPTPYATIQVAIANIPHINKPVPWIHNVIRIKRLPADEANIDERVYIWTEVVNLKDIPLENICINETLPDGFIADPEVDHTNWTFRLNPREKKSFGYSIRALRPGSFLIPGMKLSIEHNGVFHLMQTNDSEIVIHGPYIDVKKSFFYQDVGEEGLLNVTLSVNNTGDRAAYVNLTDRIPERCQLIAGNLSRGQVMQPSDAWELKYSLLLRSTENVIIPGANVRFVDSRKYSDTFESASHVLKIEESVIEEALSDEELLMEDVFQDNDANTLEKAAEDKKGHDKINSISSLKKSLINLVERAIGWRL
ncbi:hypothetical protein [Methanomethylovorans sp.]|uniref:hypothetical protein n=1 Tax=Methanomethylovorans sp. TaxID=2758717 RepID=UPI000ADD7396|nr:hypothetical protein [Methanomethylovorans sp.]